MSSSAQLEYVQALFAGLRDTVTGQELHERPRTSSMRLDSGNIVELSIPSGTSGALVQALVPELARQLPHLRELHLSNADVDVSFWLNTPGGLPDALVELELSRNCIGILTTFRHLPRSITSLDLVGSLILGPPTGLLLSDLPPRLNCLFVDASHIKLVGDLLSVTANPWCETIGDRLVTLDDGSGLGLNTVMVSLCPEVPGLQSVDCAAFSRVAFALLQRHPLAMSRDFIRALCVYAPAERSTEVADILAVL